MGLPRWIALLLLAQWACIAGGPRTVVPGRLYMAGQPDSGECRLWIERFRIRSLVNLRGSDRTRRSYLDEKTCADAAGVERLDLPFLAADDPPRHLLMDFIRRFPALQEPVLVHCRTGVDRSSLGVFLALMLWDRPFDEAASWVRSLFKHPCPRACPQKRFVDGFETWCAGRGRKPDRIALLSYVERDYCPESYRWGGDLEGVPGEAAPSSSVRFGARVTNTGRRIWVLSAEAEKGIRLGIRLYGPFVEIPGDPEAYYYDHRNEGWDACRAGMEKGTVRPGETRDWTLAFTAPAAPGLYLMAVDMVDENRAWFSDFGRPPRLSPLRITSPAVH